MKHVIVGASGQVGGYLMQELAARGETVVGTYRHHEAAGLVPLDMLDEGQSAEFLEHQRPDVVWIPAAMPDVDRCEREPQQSYALNVGAVKSVAVSAARQQARVVFFSTDYVFDGAAGPYRETDTPHPLQVYGMHKVEAEQFLLEHIPRLLIIRPAWIYSAGDNPRNFVFRTVQQLQGGGRVRAVTDQYNTPTPSDGLVKMAWKAVREGFEGVLHVAGPQRLSRYDLTLRIARAHGFSDQQVEAVETASFHLDAQRPLDGGLVTQYADYRMEAGRDYTPVF